MVLSLILHDIGWSQASTKLRQSYHSTKARLAHMKLGVRLAEKLLNKINYDKQNIKRIVRLMSVHDYPSSRIGKKLKAKDELTLSCFDFMWRATPGGFIKI